MDAMAAELVRQAADAGPRQSSGWDARLFDAYGRTVLPALWQRLPASLPEDRERTFASVLALVHEGIGQGHLTSEPEAAPTNLLEFCVRDWLPGTLAELSPAEHVPLLARVWNVAEGLLGEPAWVNAYVMARVGELASGANLEAFLVETLRPLMEPAPPARWEGPYRVTLLSLRAADDEFLPGEMHLAAPAVLIVEDRRRPARVGVHLRREGRSAVLGTFGATRPFSEEPVPVSIAWDGGSVGVGADKVGLPFFPGPFRWSAARAGYLVASAVDSQKLWIVESAA
jgi:hypothetical protein